MEHKEGRLRVRPKTMASLLAIRGIGKQDAKGRLEEMESPTETKGVIYVKS